ncbi:hypothetical protein [Parahaliea mediterranea]|uniref:hypothetical protein n=1 Tax=Parahaliea mediterranea TaxID=651086 RepID=UPI000E2FC847|nr:hypothetical protein [Parahaliea mediterranea]
MSRAAVKALLWGLAIAGFVRFGLAPTGWLFYEASFALGLDGLYWGYRIFRGGDYLLNQWPPFTFACVALGLLAALLAYRRNRRKETA